MPPFSESIDPPERNWGNNPRFGRLPACTCRTAGSMRLRPPVPSTHCSSCSESKPCNPSSLSFNLTCNPPFCNDSSDRSEAIGLVYQGGGRCGQELDQRFGWFQLP